AEDGIRDATVTGVQTCALPICARSEVLRIRRYGEIWKITHKSKGTAGRHKIRTESETKVADGQQMDAILRALGYAPSFVYEKFQIGRASCRERVESTAGSGTVI